MTASEAAALPDLRCLPLEEKLAMSGFNILASIMKDVRRPSSVRLLGQTQ